MLYELFSWFNGKGCAFELKSQTLDEAGLAHEKKQSAIHQRELRYLLYKARLSNDSTSAHKTPIAIEAQRQYADFLEALTPFIQPTPKSIAEILMAFISTRPTHWVHHLPPENWKTLWAVFLNENPDDAIALWQQWVKKEVSPSALRPALTQITIQHELKKFHQAFAHEAQPLNLTPLFVKFIDNPYQYAAAVLWLIEQNVSATDILNSGLLHQFFAYHGIDVSQDESDFYEFWFALEQFEPAAGLIKMASKTKNNTRGLEHYSLVGTFSAEASLEEITLPTPHYQYTFSPALFASLYKIFDKDFLYFALEVLYEKFNPHHFNELKVVFNTLPLHSELIVEFGKIVTRASPHLFPLFTTLIDEVSIQYLLEHQHPLPLSILLKKSIFKSYLTEELIAAYFRAASSDPLMILSNIGDFVLLFKELNKTHHPLTAFIYEGLIELLLSHPELFEDVECLLTLKQYREKDVILKKIRARLEATFEENLNQMMLSVETIDYPSLEDLWYKTSRQLRILNQILSAPSHCPITIYAFQALFAQKWHQKIPSCFSLAAYLEALNIESTFSLETQNPYERLLIELLCAIDAEPFRHEIIERFEACPEKRASWKTKTYEDKNLWYYAVSYGNLGMLEWLNTEKEFNAHECSEMVVNAATLNHWAIVEYLLKKPHKLSQVVLQIVLNCAAKDGVLPVIQYYFSRYLTSKHTQANIDKIAEIAANYNQHGVISLLFENKKTRPSDTAQVKLLKTAFTTQNKSLINFMLAQENPSPLLRKAIESSFISAANLGDVETLTMIHASPYFNPSSAVLNLAIDEAITAENEAALHTLYTLFTHALNAHRLSQVLIKIIKTENIGLLKLTYGVIATLGLKINLYPLLNEAAEKGSIALLDYMCEEAPLKPSNPYEALSIAVASGQTEITLKLLPLARSSFQQNAFHQAIKLKHYALALEILPHISLDKINLKYAMKHLHEHEASEALNALRHRLTAHLTPDEGLISQQGFFAKRAQRVSVDTAHLTEPVPITATHAEI